MPCQMVPPSVVIKTKISKPEDVSEGVDADKVLAEKWKAIQGDIALGPVGEAMGPLLTKFFSTVKNMKKDTIKQLTTTGGATVAVGSGAKVIENENVEQEPNEENK